MKGLFDLKPALQSILSPKSVKITDPLVFYSSFITNVFGEIEAESRQEKYISTENGVENHSTVNSSE
jgi:hypothetical protein